MAAIIPYAAAALTTYAQQNQGQNTGSTGANQGTQTPYGSGMFAPSAAVAGSSPANARNQITIAPVGLNLGSIIQPYIEGAKENGGSGYAYDSPASAAYMPAPYRSSHVSNLPNGTVIDAFGNPAEPDNPTKGLLIIGGLTVAAIVVVVLARRRKG